MFFGGKAPMKIEKFNERTKIFIFQSTSSRYMKINDTSNFFSTAIILLFSRWDSFQNHYVHHTDKQVKLAEFKLEIMSTLTSTWLEIISHETQHSNVLTTTENKNENSSTSRCWEGTRKEKR